jgi:hypothetical protein
MDIIGFLYVSLGSSTAQLHDSLGSRCTCSRSVADFNSQNGDRDWCVYYQRAAFCCAFFYGQKDSTQRIFIKKCFLFAIRSVCHVKRFTTGWQTFHRWCWNRGAEVAETTVKRLLCCGFQCRDETSVSVLMEDMSRSKCFFQVRISGVLYIISICDLYTDSPSYIAKCSDSLGT